jgi:hypothetical protein
VVELRDIIYVPRQTANGPSTKDGKIYLMLEIVTGGELFAKVVGQGHLDEVEALFYFRQVRLAWGLQKFRTACPDLPCCHGRPPLVSLQAVP